MKIQKMSLIILVSIITFGFGTLLNVASSNAARKAPEGEITIEGKKPAKFNHQKHFDLGLTCVKCHHDGEHKPLSEADIAGSDSDLSCGSCHNKDFANEKLNSKKLAFHARCKDCHKAGVGDKKGPTKCTGCHPKKKK